MASIAAALILLLAFLSCLFRGCYTDGLGCGGLYGYHEDEGLLFHQLLRCYSELCLSIILS